MQATAIRPLYKITPQCSAYIRVTLYVHQLMEAGGGGGYLDGCFHFMYVKYELLFLPFQPLQGGKKEFGNLKRYVNILFSSYIVRLCVFS
jgi:hypothetical protein